jgi:hypothetical protein
MRFFILNWFGQKNPSELLNKHLKYFRFWLQIRRDIRIFVHSAYYQNTEIFLPRIIRIRKFSFPVLSEYGNFHSAYYQYTNSEIQFEYLPHSAYYQNPEIFLPRIIRIRKFSFRVFSVYEQIHSTYSENAPK